MVFVWTALAWAGTSIDEVPNPRPSNRWITDQAQVLDAAQELELEVLLQRVHEETDAEITVVTLHDTTDEPKAFATGLFEHWGIGDAEANNGLLVLLVVDRRRLEMETGYGLEATLPDGWLGTMQARHMVPHFRDGRYDRGLKAGLEEVAERLRGEVGAVRTGAGPTARSRGALPEWAPLVGVGWLGLVFGLGGWWWRRRKQRTCPRCDIQMNRLSEQADDAHLTEAEQHEETIGSVDHQVYICPQCDFSRTLAVMAWFSGYGRCAACGTKARRSTTTTVRHATYHRGGLVRIEEECTYCDDTSTHTRSTPRRRRTSRNTTGLSSFGGGGGGGFGGGSSGGGGAGSSW